MNSLDIQYANLLWKIHKEGTWEKTRTGTDAKTIVGAMIQHDMKEGFPLLCCKKHPFKVIAVELEGFLKGIRSKNWFKERGCNIWNLWCNPQSHPYGTDEHSKEVMEAEDDLGRIYGVQWRDFQGVKNIDTDIAHFNEPCDVDQVTELINILRRDPTSRRAIVTAWNPCELNQMALPPCHILWQVMIVDNKLHLTWYQRSVDTPLGLPFNIASYGLLLHLLARELGYEEGTLTGFLNNVHYYRNQEEAVLEIIYRRKSRIGFAGMDIPLPRIKTYGDASLKYLLDGIHANSQWDHSLSELENYNPLPAIKIPISI
jgi:thymidylate synthase